PAFNASEKNDATRRGGSPWHTGPQATTRRPRLTRRAAAPGHARTTTTGEEGHMMHRKLHRTLGIMALVGLLGVSQSWGGPPNNDVSDALGNTAGGTGALSSITSGTNNTAFGSGALGSTTSGIFNTAVGRKALFSNVDGFSNTAIGRKALQSNA